MGLTFQVSPNFPKRHPTNDLTFLFWYFATTGTRGVEKKGILTYREKSRLIIILIRCDDKSRFYSSCINAKK